MKGDLVVVENKTRSDRPSVTHMCIHCNKFRMIRPADYEINYSLRDLETPRGETLSIPQDICRFCEEKIIRKYFKPTRSDAKKVLDAMANNDTELDGDTSLEDLL